MKKLILQAGSIKSLLQFRERLISLQIASIRMYFIFHAKLCMQYIPHESIKDITIDGYDIPKKSRLIVNFWSIARDPNVWSENVEEFCPERFTNNNIDLRGHDYQLIPFGTGRRGCPGMQLGLTTVRLVLAQLVHCFSWELPNGMLPQDLDMTEKFGLSLSKAKRLLAKLTYRLM